LERERAAQIVLRDDLVADFSVGECATPQGGRTVRFEADRLIERACGLVRLAHAQEGVAQAFPRD